MKRIAMNGFGRVGRTIVRINTLKKRFNLVAINDINPYLDNMAYLLKYDSTYGKFPGTVRSGEESITINGKQVRYSSHPRMSDVDWGKIGVDLIIDASGVAANVSIAKKLVADGITKKVIVTHSAKLVDNEIIMGVNDHTLKASDNVVSSSICDSNAIAHIMKWVDEEYGIKSGAVTTVHPWLSYQNLVDGPAISESVPGNVWDDYALGRASLDSVIPKKTTAITAVQKVLPQLNDKIMSFSYRIPTKIVASCDITLQTKRRTNVEHLKEFLHEKIEQSRYVRANYESLVSIDYEREEASAVIDMQWIQVENGMLKIVLWYDNEWGYSERVLDLADRILGF